MEVSDAAKLTALEDKAKYSWRQTNSLVKVS